MNFTAKVGEVLKDEGQVVNSDPGCWVQLRSYIVLSVSPLCRSQTALNGAPFARDLLCGLLLHLSVRYILHLSAYPPRSPRQAVRHSARRRHAESTDVAGRRRSDP